MDLRGLLLRKGERNGRGGKGRGREEGVMGDGGKSVNQYIFIVA